MERRHQETERPVRGCLGGGGVKGDKGAGRRGRTEVDVRDDRTSADAT